MKKVNTLFKRLTEWNDYIYLIALVLFLFSSIMNLTFFSLSTEGNDNELFLLFTKGLRYLSYILFLVKLALEFISDHTQLGRRFIILTIAVFCLLFVGMFYADDRKMLIGFFVVLAAHKVSDQKIIWTCLLTQSIILAAVVMLSQLGIIQDYIWADRERHFLGFAWTTTAPILFFYIVLQYLYLRKFMIRVRDLIVIMAINVWFFAMTNTRFAFLLLSASVILAYIYAHTPLRKWKLEKLKYCLVLSPWLIAAFSICLHAFYDSSSLIWARINSLLTTRPYMGYTAIHTYGISLFGNAIEWIGNGLDSESGLYNYVDCSYLQLLLQFGVIFLIIVLAAYSYIMYQAVKEKRYSACWIILIVLIFGITEPRLVNIAFNPFILLVLADTSASELNIPEPD